MKTFRKIVAIVLICVFSFCSSYAQVSREKVQEFVDKWIGAPYRYAGSTIKGIDCSGLTQKMAKDIFGLDIGRSTIYQMKDVIKIEADSIQSGDLIFFRSKYSPSGYHVGFYLWDGKFMHAASRKLGVIISELSSYSTYLMVGRITPILKP